MESSFEYSNLNQACYRLPYHIKHWSFNGEVELFDSDDDLFTVEEESHNKY